MNSVLGEAYVRYVQGGTGLSVPQEIKIVQNGRRTKSYDTKRPPMFCGDSYNVPIAYELFAGD